MEPSRASSHSEIDSRLMNSPSGADDAPISILIVEDSPSLLRLYSHILSQAGYRILEAATGRAALQILWDQRPDIVLLDRVLPDMDGGDICRSIKEQPEFASSYVVMLSALKTSEDDRVSGLEAGADDYVVKPVGRRELLARIQVAARLRRTQLALQASAESCSVRWSKLARHDQPLRSHRATSTPTAPSSASPAERPKHTWVRPSTRRFPHELMDFWRRSLAQVFEKGRLCASSMTCPSTRKCAASMPISCPNSTPTASRSVLAVSRDVTAHAEQEIARLATVVEQAVETVLITDTHGLIVYANAAFEAMTGCRAADILGQSLPDLRAIYTDDFCNHYRSLIAAGIPWSGLTRCRCRSGMQCEIEISVFPIRDRSGAIINYAVMQRDITERRRVESEREALLSVAASLRKAATRAEMLPIVLDQIMSALNLTGALCLTTDADSGEVTVEWLQRTRHMTGRRLTPEKPPPMSSKFHMSTISKQTTGTTWRAWAIPQLPLSLMAQHRCVGVPGSADDDHEWAPGTSP